MRMFRISRIRRKLMLNYIQLALGAASIVMIFLGLYTAFKKLDKEDSSKLLPVGTIIRSMIMIAVGLLFYAGVKTCTNIAAGAGEEYDITVIYMASAVDVIKYFGFFIFIPLLINFIRRKPVKNEG